MEAAAPPQTAPESRPADGPPLLGAAAVAIAVAVVAINIRMDDPWGTGIFLVMNAAACAALLFVGISALTGSVERPSGETTAVLVSGYVLLALAIGNLADILGAEGGSGSTFWTTLLFATIVWYPAWVLRSPISALFDAVASGIAFLAFIDWVFDYSSFQTLRWLLLILIVVYAAGSFVASGTSERHGVQMVNAAGLTLLALALSVFIAAVATQFAQLIAPFGARATAGGPTGWEFVELVAAAALVGYAAVRREPGPAYLGAISLFLFVSSAALPGDDGASLIGWPILLVLLAIGLAAGGAALGGGIGGSGAGGSSRSAPPGAPGAGTPPPSPPAAG